MMGSAEGQSRYYEAALCALRFVEARRATRRRFGPEADATSTAFRGDFGTSARIDLLLRNADAQWPGAFGARSVYGLASLDIVHRDLKLENVFLSRGRWKLGDFGISKSLARLAAQGRTFQGHGTLGFAPPEQLDGAEAHPSADIFAFGKLLAYLTTGQTDVDQIRWPTWGPIARDCTARLAEQRPTLDDVETEVVKIVS